METKINIISGAGGSCFRAGTQVQLEGGKTVAIEKLQPGDKILSFDEKGNVVEGTVSVVHRHTSAEPITRVRFWNGSIDITKNHWVLNQYGAFVEIGSLSVDDAVVDGMGHLRPIISMEHVADEEVWNLTVLPHHTFIANGIRVHNGGYRNRFPVIAGAGGGSGKGSGGHTPVEDADTLQSRAMVSVLDLLGEGQIGGLVNGAQSVYLDDTPLQNPDLSMNFQGVTWDIRNGTQNQTPIDGFPDVETPFNVSVQLKNPFPYTFSILNPNADMVRVVMTFPSITSTDNSTGDIHGTTIQYKFSVSNNGGPFVDMPVDDTGNAVVTITGKTKSKYQRSHLIRLPQPGSNYQIRVTRLTADSTSSLLTNDSYVDSYYEIVNTKLAYPNSVIFGITIDSSQFNSIPARSYLVDGLYIKVPSNYDPVSRNYSGVWDGTFKLAVSNNPAWVLYDLLLNTRYGLGQFINPSAVNKAQLYTIGRYCDGMVDDGYGGQEPRFTINTVIQTMADAYKVVSDIASTFRGMAFWSGGMVTATQDSPADPVMLYNAANVVGGGFAYMGSARKDRHSVVLVTYNDPNNKYKQAIEYVEDPDLIQKFGIRKTDTVAFGCTSRGQAHRVGQWILYTEKVETDMIVFTVGLDSALVLPGDIVKIHDQYRAGKRMGGRITAATAFGITLDAPVNIDDTTGNTMVSIMMPDGTFQDRMVHESGTTSTLSWSQSLPALPVNNALWILTEPGLQPVLGRVIDIKQGQDPGTFQITCTQHNPSKYAAIENGLTLEVIPTTILDPTYSTPENMRIDETTYFVSPGNLGIKLHVSWEGKSPQYEVSWRRSDAAAPSNWVTTTVTTPTFDLLGAAEDGQYDFSVVGVSVTGKRSDALVGTYQVLGTMNPPQPPSNLTAVGDFRAILLNWSNPSSIDLDHIEIWENSVNDSTTATHIANAQGSSFTRAGLPGLTTRFYWVKAVNKRGMESAFNSNLGTSATTTQATHDDVVQQFIDKSLLVPELVAGLDGNSAVIGELQNYFDQAAAAQSTLNAQAARIAALETFVQSIQSGNTEYVTQEQLLTAKNDVQQAVVDTVTGTLVGPSGAIAQQIATYKTTVDNQFASLQVTAETLNGLQSQYTVKIDNNGYVSGFGLASDASNGVPTSEFLVVADRFAIAQPDGGVGATYPFIVTTVNGIPRVSMNSAFITSIIAATLQSPDNKFRIDLQNKLISIEV